MSEQPDAITVTLSRERFEAVQWAIHMGINLRNMAVQEALIEASNDFGLAAGSPPAADPALLVAALRELGKPDRLGTTCKDFEAPETCVPYWPGEPMCAPCVIRKALADFRASTKGTPDQ